MKLLNLSPADRVDCYVIYVVNRFEVYHRDDWMMTAAQTVDDLKKQLADNGIIDPSFSALASEKLEYMGF
jgi:hypothetical protein